MSDKKDSNPDQVFVAAGAAVFFAALPVALLGITAWKYPELIVRYKTWLIRTGVSMICGFGLAYLLFGMTTAPWRSIALNREAFLGFSIGDLFNFAVLIWGIGCGLVLVIAPLVLKPKSKSDPNLVRKDDFKPIEVKDMKFLLRQANKLFLDPDQVPIGINLKTLEVVMLDQKRRTYHVLGLGVTGMGKSNFILLLILHALYHEHPCIIIDPKGDEAFIREILKLARLLCPLSRRRIKIFKLSKPEGSAKYNPLRYGNASQLKDKLLEALNWSEQYYQSKASEFLSEFVSVVSFLGLELNLAMIRRALFDSAELLKILAMLKQKAVKGDVRAGELAVRFGIYVERVKKDDLLGLAAQLAILDSPDLGSLFSWDKLEKGEEEIDLRRLYENNEVAYFQLDTQNNADTARRLGRVIVEDVKSLSHYIYSNFPDEEQRKFVPFLIDEFGSFATKEFIETLKQARGAKIGVHLFCHGLEDLDVVSHEFARQGSSNPATILAWRLNDRRTVDEVCSTAGTVDTLEGSYQVEQGLLGQNPTGLGNMRQGKQMVIEHDVPKNLNVGEAVLIMRSPSSAAPIRLFKAADLVEQ